MADIHTVPEDEKLMPLRLDAARILNSRNCGSASATRILERWRDETFAASSALTTAALILDDTKPLAAAVFRKKGARLHRLYTELADVLKGRSP